ncbi:hypothetical protein BRCON_1217 [Candidatus Sumerlaea chitinivorans]|uniref:Uncharacterized protein n=1 Tax=Sumerlaea chitinivorans TaxID=2250252 RepID=A0A2Z4Y4C3_SUMC1|nr:hypothetical protein BRCON_1217 [Candidatus Sumerlaea chitinivorans]
MEAVGIPEHLQDVVFSPLESISVAICFITHELRTDHVIGCFMCVGTCEPFRSQATHLIW